MTVLLFTIFTGWYTSFLLKFFFFTAVCCSCNQSASTELAQLQQFLIYSPGLWPFAQTCCPFLTWCTPPSRSRSPQRKWKGTQPWHRCRWCQHRWVCRHTWNNIFSPPYFPPSAWTFSSLALPPQYGPHRVSHCWGAESGLGGWKSPRPGSCQSPTERTEPWPVCRSLLWTAEKQRDGNVSFLGFLFLCFFF